MFRATLSNDWPLLEVGLAMVLLAGAAVVGAGAAADVAVLVGAAADFLGAMFRVGLLSLVLLQVAVEKIRCWRCRRMARIVNRRSLMDPRLRVRDTKASKSSL